MKKSLLHEILKRRTDISCVLQYLYNRNQNELPSEFPKLKKSDCHKRIYELFKTFYLETEESAEESTPAPTTPRSYKEELCLFTSAQCGGNAPTNGIGIRE